MELVVDPGGTIRCIYSEAFDLHLFGPMIIARASRVEPDEQGQWTADLSPVAGPILGPYLRRSEALAAEQAWLEMNWLRHRRS